VATEGTSDMPVVEGAEITKIIIAVDRIEDSLASIIGGMANCPVIAHWLQG